MLRGSSAAEHLNIGNKARLDSSAEITLYSYLLCTGFSHGGHLKHGSIPLAMGGGGMMLA